MLIIGYVGVPEMAASVITGNFLVVICMSPYALGQAATTLIGNSLGAGKP